MKKKIISGTILLFILALIYYFFVLPESDVSGGSPAAAFVVKREMELHRGDIRVTVSATGVVTPVNVIEIKSKASGIVEQIPVEASDRVRVGQLIAKLDQTDTRNAFEQAFADSQVAAATLIQQENNWKRSKDLFEKQLISQQDYDQYHVDYVRSKAALVKAQSALLLARQKLAETIVLSPVNGLVLSRNVSAGQIIASAVSNVGGGTVIARVANMDEVYVVAGVDEVDIGRVSIGQETRIIADAYPDLSFTGKVVRIAAQSTVTQNVTTFDVIILVPNRRHLLKAGMNASITIDIDRRENALLIANDLLRDRQELQNDMRMLTEAAVKMDPLEKTDRKKPADSLHSGRTKRDPGSDKDFSKKRKKPAGDGKDPVETSQSETVKFVVIDDRGELRMQAVRIGLSNFDESEVLSGLTDSTRVMMIKASQVRREAEMRKDRMKARSGFNPSGGR